MKYSFGFVVCLILVTGIGCGAKKDNYAKVKGTVTLNGKPLDKGEVFFILAGKPAACMVIVDGKFSGQAMVGSNKIQFSVTKKTGKAPVLPPNAALQMKAYREKGVSQGGADPKAVSGADSTVIDIIPP